MTNQNYVNNILCLLVNEAIIIYSGAERIIVTT